MLAPTAMSLVPAAFLYSAEKAFSKMTASRVIISISTIAMLLSVTCNAAPDALGYTTEERLERSRKYAALKREKKDIEERRQNILASKPFRFSDLPPEICLLILEQCSPDCFIALLQVSQALQRLTYQACLPRLGIALVDSEKIASLKAWLYNHKAFRPYLRHLWIEPWNDDDFDACVDILQQCTKVESLVCAAQMLEAAVGSSAQLRHLSCRSLTLPNISSNILPSLAGTPAGAAFLAQLTHLRIMGDNAPRGVHFPNLTHLSYWLNVSTGDEVLHDKETFPSLEKIILTQRRRTAGGIRISRSRNANVFTFQLPQQWTEQMMWHDCVHGHGIWDR